MSLSAVHVCPLSKLEQVVTSTNAGHLLSLLAAGTEMVRPPSIPPRNHLHLVMHDIAQVQEGMTLPGEEHVRSLLDFACRWDRARPLVVHCYAGISRSTAAAFTAVCALNPRRNELEIAQAIRRASMIAQPNARFVALADQALGRRGRMIEAVRAIGPGNGAYEGEPFRLDL